MSQLHVKIHLLELDKYKLIINLINIVECKVGYFEENCSLQCPYNTYGKHCQQECLCSEDECDFQQGCRNEKSGKVNL